MQLQPLSYLKWYHLFLPLSLTITDTSNYKYLLIAEFFATNAGITFLKYNNQSNWFATVIISAPELQFIENIIKLNTVELGDTTWILANKQTICQRFMFHQYTLVIADFLKYLLLEIAVIVWSESSPK